MYLKKIKKNVKNNTKEPEKFLSVNYAKNITGSNVDMLSKVVEKYKELEDKGIICSSGQYKSTETQQFHEQSIFNSKTIKLLKQQKKYWVKEESIFSNI
ncbi:7249_t:CDS:2 [Gigaspora margarita]|uniref:7249_t:CDS:1 n=1 Tax=Gigaspora margarita TaxID=4874 RepID=A0ABN7X279_GIGMA|nr:7249_t:CDS:2 [Gigaspora margarita]